MIGSDRSLPQTTASPTQSLGRGGQIAPSPTLLLVLLCHIRCTITRVFPAKLSASFGLRLMSTIGSRFHVIHLEPQFGQEPMFLSFLTSNFSPHLEHVTVFTNSSLTWISQRTPDSQHFLLRGFVPLEHPKPSRSGHPEHGFSFFAFLRRTLAAIYPPTTRATTLNEIGITAAIHTYSPSGQQTTPHRVPLFLRDKRDNRKK